MSVYTLSLSRFETGIFGLIALVIAAQSHAQNSSLDGSAHASAIEFKPVFETELLPLDALLPWRERFKGNEEFDEAFSLSGQIDTSRLAKKEMKMKAEEPTMTQSDFDGKGMVKLIRDNKVKIAHGPIDKFGMPAMSMIFKVSDPKMLQGLQAGTQIEFNVEQSAGGFIVTNIKR
ncbi:MAG: copper-binding protein [Arenicellales bacterium WSBS_2016_MAG_OTU3]